MNKPDGKNEIDRLETLVATWRISLPENVRADDYGKVHLALADAQRALAERLRYIDPARSDALRSQARDAYWKATLHGGRSLTAIEHSMANSHYGALASPVLYDAMRSGIGSCLEAAKQISRDEHPEHWTIAQINLAEACLALYVRRPRSELIEIVKRGGRLADELLCNIDTALESGRAAVAFISVPSEEHGRALRALSYAHQLSGKSRQDSGSLNHAIATALTAVDLYQRDAAPEEWADSMLALGAALHARAEASLNPSFIVESVDALRAAYTYWRDRSNDPNKLLQVVLGNSLMLQAKLGATKINDLLIERARQHALTGTFDSRLAWAHDALAVVATMQSQRSPGIEPPVADLLAEMKAFAERHNQLSLLEAWAAGISPVEYWHPASAGLRQQLRDVIDNPGSPYLRLAWARLVSPQVPERRPPENLLEVVDDLHGLAEKHDEVELRKVWCKAAFYSIASIAKWRTNAATDLLIKLKSCSHSSADPFFREYWAAAACCMLVPEYCEANIDFSRHLLRETQKDALTSWAPKFYWPRAARAVHKSLFAVDMIGARAVRGELLQYAQALKKEDRNDALKEWREAIVDAIHAIRMQDYECAMSLLHELGQENAESGELKQARSLVNSREVQLAHGLIKEILKRLDIAPAQVATEASLRVSRLNASKAPHLATVGAGLYCHELVLTGTAIESLPDDITVTQRIDVSQCHGLKRLPTGLKVGRLEARGCTALETLPAGLQVSYLDLTGCTALTALPDDLIVRNGRLTLHGCERLRMLPDGIGPLAQLDISGCLNITTLPPKLVVTAWIDVGGSGLTALPAHLEGVDIRWLGVRIDERIAFRPETLDAREILDEPNAERRRVMMERFGLDRFMAQAQAQVLHEDRDAGGPRRLLRIELPNDEPLVCVSVVCPSTLRQFMLRVPPTMTTCREAVAWTAGFDDPDAYAPAVET